jgi:hypothetical protein
MQIYNFCILQYCEQSVKYICALRCIKRGKLGINSLIEVYCIRNKQTHGYKTVSETECLHLSSRLNYLLSRCDRVSLGSAEVRYSVALW